MAILYSQLKFLRFQDHLNALRDQKVVAPVHIRIKPTNRCNHNCWYCAYRVDNLQLGDGMDLEDEIPVDKMMQITDDIIAMGVKAVTFSGGGEPLLYKALPDVIDRLAGAGIKVAALSNGANLRGRMADAFAEHGTWLRVSMDAWDDQSYQQSRGAPVGGFPRLMRNLADFSARNSQCVLGISFIVGKNNFDHIAEVAGMLKEAGVNHMKISGAVVDNEAAGNNLYHAEIQAEVAAQINAAKRLEDGSFTVLNHYHDLEERFQKEYKTCAFLQFLTVIGADQCVYTCQDKAYNAAGLLGSIKEQGFRQFWFSEENRKKLFSFDPSVSCGHHCVTHAKNLAIQEFLAIDPDHGMFV
ncbi:MAG: Fe-S [Rhodospirillaceae bacterium]|nr:MAG: Fe-S [Rhodospirillaceae bacterium]TNC97449.1 MAG: Fe-S oxidoreductase [Stygiobacter sp.]